MPERWDSERDAEVVRLLAEFAQAEQDGTAEKATLMVGPFTGYLLISALQLALRHPALSDLIRDTLEQFIARMRPWFGGVLGEAIDAGLDPASDEEPRHA